MTETASNIATTVLALAERNVPRYRLPQGYVQNAPDIGSYLRAIDARQFAVKKGFALSSDDRTRARIIERLMCDFAVDLDRCDATSDFSAELFEIDRLSDVGIVARQGRQIFVTEEGRPLVRLVAAVFDSYRSKKGTLQLFDRCGGSAWQDDCCSERATDLIQIKVRR
jgi:hypothetical protein